MKLTSKWSLIRGDDGIILYNHKTDESFGPSDSVTLYPSWGFQPAAVAVNSHIKRKKGSLDDPGNELAKAFVEIRRTEPKDGYIHIRCTKAQKARFIAASRAKGVKLTEWILDAGESMLVSTDHT